MNIEKWSSVNELLTKFQYDAAILAIVNFPKKKKIVYRNKYETGLMGFIIILKKYAWSQCKNALDGSSLRV